MTVISTLATPAQEEGTYAITVSFFNHLDQPVTPDSATWTLSDLEGNVINSKSQIVLTGLSTSKIIVLSGEDLSIGSRGTVRELLVEAVYDSVLGNDLPMKQAVRFTIEPLVKVT